VCNWLGVNTNRVRLFHIIVMYNCFRLCLFFVLQNDVLEQLTRNAATTLLIRNCSTIPNANYFKCISTNECIRRNLVGDGLCHCTKYDNYNCDDEDFDVSYGRNTISFQTICDGFTHLSSTSIEDQTETDETNCEQWLLIHIYNRCDGFWNILNGSDEIYCNSSISVFNCSINHHICVSPTTNQLICLPIEKANDGIIDCLGAVDEPTVCQNELNGVIHRLFYCKQTNNSPCLEASRICDRRKSCNNYMKMRKLVVVVIHPKFHLHLVCVLETMSRMPLMQSKYFVDI
jgi:hypothetical protein